VTLALIDAPEAWTARLTKMRMPYEFLVAAMRITGRVPEDPGALLNPLSMLGMPFWTPPGPNGFPDTAAAWASPEGMKLRLDVASQAASRLRDPPDPREPFGRDRGRGRIGGNTADRGAGRNKATRDCFALNVAGGAMAMIALARR
jgi:uncharacterized protein (DUF1800 family)